ncbi:myristylated tegument protein [Gallid alphaherpesvirus 1]|uniref:Myristylated membrane protein n=1 Tax=Infectious laryngotracheitis virus TaxID=10386 RepID=Q9QP14_ILTV|nr:myristylated tegument protein [Gallid alphaherpesvirus 1]YP_182384.1 myristylated tegument protein [Gallid alphaherpesvirus 1]AEB97346.1 myristylated tegument protein [Gallid alphaherpesvirus 1]AER28079.1 myristylated tegument protein [Gallid alphaherpesvirus 1]AER28158.1 myristylated tegument protein [Gallid alphaherpesvirus 1]AEW67798.1 myristylated tegument protein [Gallid alphaherpesvirus 1]AEW67877.1 myristylated tegument protein [Gallid alphaherpesvirus 1]
MGQGLCGHLGECCCPCCSKSCGGDTRSRKSGERLSLLDDSFDEFTITEDMPMIQGGKKKEKRSKKEAEPIVVEPVAARRH